MRHYTAVLSHALRSLKGNMERNGDPLGFQRNYWASWARGLDLPAHGSTLLMTGRMYQMLPYVSSLMNMARGLRPILSVKGSDRALRVGQRILGETILAWRAKGEYDLQERAERILQGISRALHTVQEPLSYLPNEDFYSGILPFQLGLEGPVEHHARAIQRFLTNHGIQRIITVDPHTTLMLRDIIPRILGNFSVEVRHYLEILSEKTDLLKGMVSSAPETPFVLHDPCVMARDLHCTEPLRKVADVLGIALLETENRGQNTLCCGGPVEYAFENLAGEISCLRLQELARVARDILVYCPICLATLKRHQARFGVRVWDMGELLYSVTGRSNGCI